MDFFDKLKSDGYFADTFLDKSLVQFCFLSTIQAELEEVASSGMSTGCVECTTHEVLMAVHPSSMQCLNSTGPRTTCIAQVWRRSRPAWGSVFTKTSHVMKMCFTFVWGLCLSMALN
ncbi:unnamed protein product [Gadus morhua 'NCC']